MIESQLYSTVVHKDMKLEVSCHLCSREILDALFGSNTLNQLCEIWYNAGNVAAHSGVEYR